MDLVTVRQIYKDREQYLNKEISIGGWVRSLRDSKAFGFIVLRHFRWSTTTPWRTFQKYPN